MSKENILTGVGVAAVLGLFGLSIYSSCKEAEELRNYKSNGLRKADLQSRIYDASIENSNFNVEEKYDAKKVLEYYENKAKNAPSKYAFDDALHLINTLITKFTSENHDRSLISLFEARDSMDSDIADEARKAEDARRREELRQQTKNTEMLAKALADANNKR